MSEANYTNPDIAPGVLGILFASTAAFYERFEVKPMLINTILVFMRK